MTYTIEDLSQLNLISPNSVAYARYWASLPKVGLLPDRGAFAPEDISALLPTFVILEIVSPAEIRFRLAGTAEAERYGRDVTGLNYLDFVDSSRRTKAAAAFEAMAAKPCGMIATIQSKTVSGLDFINEAIGLPMRWPDHPRPLLYFQSNTLNNHALRIAQEDRLAEHVRVSRRLFIDLGAGVPDFAD